MRVRIQLNTMNDINSFVKIVSNTPEHVTLEDGHGYIVAANSVLGVAYSKMEWKEIYCVCDKDISGSILPWIV